MNGDILAAALTKAFKTPPTLEQLLADICGTALAQEGVYSNDDKALQALHQDPTKFYTLFQTPLRCSDAYDNMLYHNADLLVAFVADTDASFTFIISHGRGSQNNPLYTAFPVNLKAGETRLAWRGKGPFPGIRVVFHKCWIENLKGAVRCINAFLASDPRRDFVQRKKVFLDDDGWFTAAGMIGEDRSQPQPQDARPE